MVFLSSFKQIKTLPVQNYLSKKEIDLYNNILPAKKEDWLVGRYSAKEAVHNYFLENFQKDFKLNKIEILRKEINKPAYKLPIKQTVKTNISISHCEGLAVSAIAENKTDGLVGIDIEKIRNFKLKEIKSFLTGQELSQILKQNLENKNKIATLFWSIKESYLKAIGRGLVYHPKFIELKINLEDKTCELYDKNKKIPAKIEWQVFKKEYLIAKVNIIAPL